MASLEKTNSKYVSSIFINSSFFDSKDIKCCRVNLKIHNQMDINDALHTCCVLRCMKWKITYNMNILIRTYKSICMYTLYMPVSNTWLSKKLYVYRNWCWFIIIFIVYEYYCIYNGAKSFLKSYPTPNFMNIWFHKTFFKLNNSRNKKCMKIELAIHKSLWSNCNNKSIYGR